VRRAEEEGREREGAGSPIHGADNHKEKEKGRKALKSSFHQQIHYKPTQLRKKKKKRGKDSINFTQG